MHGTGPMGVGFLMVFSGFCRGGFDIFGKLSIISIDFLDVL